MGTVLEWRDKETGMSTSEIADMREKQGKILALLEAQAEKLELMFLNQNQRIDGLTKGYDKDIAALQKEVDDLKAKVVQHQQFQHSLTLMQKWVRWLGAAVLALAVWLAEKTVSLSDLFKQ